MRSQAAATPRLGSPRGATYVALTDWVGQYYMAHMVRRTPEHRFQDLLDAATRVFIAQGYRRTQVADVAEAMRVAKGTVYLYVESKEALFDAALRYADAPGPVPAPQRLPVSTPPAGRTLRYVRERLGQEPPSPTLVTALGRRRGADARRELEAIVRELYATLSRHRTGLKLVDRCAAEYPELGAVWFGQGRQALLGTLARYIEARARSRDFRKVADVGVAARIVLETIVFWAVHRHWDPSPQRVDAGAAEETLVQMIRGALVEDPTR
jgi:AcrR family transcriptional regulator